MNDKDENYITNFGMKGRYYCIYPDKVHGNRSPADKKKGHSVDSEVVGQLRIGEHSYIVTLLMDNETGSPRQPENNHEKNPSDVLTKRELQIVMLVADGKPNKQIAQQLKISEWTVSTHLRRIFAKLDVDSRAAMIYRCSKLIEMFKP